MGEDASHSSKVPDNGHSTSRKWTWRGYLGYTVALYGATCAASAYPLAGAALGALSAPAIAFGRPSAWARPDAFQIFKYSTITLPALFFGLHPFWPLLPMWVYNCLFVANLLEVAVLLELKHSKIMALCVALHGLACPLLQVNADGVIGFDGGDLHACMWAIGWAVMYTRLYLFNPRFIPHPWRYQGVISGLLPSVLLLLPAFRWLWTANRVYSLNLSIMMDAFLQPQMNGPDGPRWMHHALRAATVVCTLLILPGLWAKINSIYSA